MTYTNKTRAGALLFIGTAWFLMGIVVSEALYPGYHVTQMISDLGVGSTALVFNSSIIVFGVLLIAVAYLLQKEDTDIWFSALMALVGGKAQQFVPPKKLIKWVPSNGQLRFSK